MSAARATRRRAARDARKAAGRHARALARGFADRLAPLAARVAAVPIMWVPPGADPGVVHIGARRGADLVCVQCGITLDSGVAAADMLGVDGRSTIVIHITCDQCGPRAVRLARGWSATSTGGAA